MDPKAHEGDPVELLGTATEDARARRKAEIVLVARWRLVWVTDIMRILKGNGAVEKVCCGVAVSRTDDRVCLEPVAAFVFLPGTLSSSTNDWLWM